MAYTSIMRMLGVDPGLTTVGLGLIEIHPHSEPRVIEWLTIETDSGLPLPERLRELADDFGSFLKEAKPDLAVVEKIFFAKNKRTAIETAHARGVLLATLALQGIDIIEITPAELKMAITGDGTADKKQMQTMVKRMLKLKEIPTPADAADGLALALYGACTKNARSFGKNA